MRTIFTTYIDGQPTTHDTFEAAARQWDSDTHQLPGPVPGGISIQQFRDDVMVRDGWLLHVHDNGVVYISPTLHA